MFHFKYQGTFLKFNKKFDESIFLDYCENKRGFRIYNRMTLVIQEAIHITFNGSNDDISRVVVRMMI